MKTKLIQIIPGFPEAEAEAMFKDCANKEGQIDFAAFEKVMKKAPTLEKVAPTLEKAAPTLEKVASTSEEKK